MNENLNHTHSLSAVPTVFAGGGVQVLPAHLCELPDKEWAVWRSVALRGAGFPSDWVLKLASEDCAVAVNDLFEAEAELLSARKTAINVLQNHFHQTEAGDHVHLINAMRSIKKGKLPNAHPFEGEIESGLNALRDSHTRHTAALDNFKRTYDLAVVQTSHALRETLNQDRFREATSTRKSDRQLPATLLR